MTKQLLIFIGLSFFILGCSSNMPVSENKPSTIKKEKVIRVQQGTITAIKNVSVQDEKSNAARTVGSITGSVLGAGSVPYIGSIFGSMIGGAVGSSADDGLSRKPGMEITLLLETGEQVIVTQLATTKFKTGDKVKLVLQDDQAQVVPLQTI